MKLGKISKLVLLGGGEFVLQLLCWCNSNGLNCKVITSPRHANERLNGEFFHEKLQAMNADYLIIEDITNDDVARFIGDMGEGLALSLGAAWIFNEDVISSTFKNRLFNLHGTRLPQNRGGGGYSWQILMGVRLGFCQFHQIEPGVDTGNIFKTKEFLYPAFCRKPVEYQKFYRQENFAFICQILSELMLSEVDFQPKQQIDYLSTYWPRLNATVHGWIDWNLRIDMLERFALAFDEPYSGCMTTLNGKKVFLKDVLVDFSENSYHPFQWGLVYRVSKGWIAVCANGGSLILTQVLNEEGENIISNIVVGERLFTPALNLEERNTRVIYSPSHTIIRDFRSE